jgi:hypothetical protein
MLAALVVSALLLPITLTGHSQARGEPNGDWAVAGGLAFGPLAASFVAAPDLAPLAVFHVFGRKLMVLPLRSPLGRVQVFSKRGSQESSVEHIVRDLARASEGLERVLQILRDDHRFRVESLRLGLDYSFRDVALTGRLLGALYAVSAVLPERVTIEQTPRWDAQDRFTIEADLRLKVWPGRLAFELARFVLKRRQPVQATES